VLFQRRLSNTGGEEMWGIFTMKPDGTNVTRVTPEDQDATDAAFSPDGSSIVYSGSADDGASIFVLRLGGGTPVRVTRSAPYDGAPTFSPDGAFVAFESADVDEGPTNIMWAAVPH
jgi:TolB protein